MAEKINFNVDSLIQNIQNFEAKKSQDIEFFLDQFQELIEAANIPDILRLVILKSKLAGDAKQVLINSPDLRNETDFDNFKEKLKHHFKTDKSFTEAQDLFITAKQSPSQSVDDFAKYFNLISQRYLAISGHAAKEGAIDLLKTIKLSRFIESLRPDLSFELQKYGPESFEDAVKQAKKIEIALNNSKLEINTLQHGANSPIYEAIINFSKEQSNQIEDLKQQINALKINDKKQQTREKTEIPFCHICHKSNHMTQNCYFNSKNNRVNQNQFLTPNIPKPQGYRFPRSFNPNQRINRQFNPRNNFSSGNNFQRRTNIYDTRNMRQGENFNTNSFAPRYEQNAHENYNPQNFQSPPPFFMQQPNISGNNSFSGHQFQNTSIKYPANSQQNAQFNNGSQNFHTHSNLN